MTATQEPVASGSSGTSEPAETTGGATAERARDGLEHLQAAARELIAAARAALDVAEDIVDDPSIVKDLAESRSPEPSRPAGPTRPAGPATWLETVASVAGAFGPLGELIRSSAMSGRPPEAGSGRGGDADGAGEAPSGNGAAPAVERIILR